MFTPIDRAYDAQYIERWTMIGSHHHSNVASHSFNVSIIAMAIWQEMYNKAGISRSEVCEAAILHDIREVYTGDIPTPTKERMKRAGFDPDGFDPDIPDEMDPSEDVAAILKLADVIDSALFVTEHATGTRGRAAVPLVVARADSAIACASPDLRQAAERVYQTIKDRSSETESQRGRVEEDRKRLARILDFKCN